MTKELAIKILSTRDKYGVPCGYTSGYEEALDMAIEALQRTPNAFPTHECVKPTHECVEKQVTGKLINVETPTKRKPEEAEKQVKGDLISREDAMMQARPEYLNPIQKGHEEYNKAWNDAIEAYWNGLKELPSEPVGISDNIEEMLQRFAQIMRNSEDMKILLSQRTGHWIKDAEQSHVEVCYHCSECGFEAWGEHEKTSFCGGCGAWMTEEEVRGNEQT